MPKRKLFSNVSKRHKRRLVQNELACINSDGHLPLADSVSDHELEHDSISDSNNATGESVPYNESDESIISLDVSVGDVNRQIPVPDQRSDPIDETSLPNINIDKTADFKMLLADWAVTCQVSHAAITSLLSVLKTHPCHSKLPKHAKSLLSTPRTSTIREMPPGQYCHFGIEKGIREFLTNRTITETALQIQIGIDGLPISQSSSNQLWPILGRVVPNGKVFMIGCYFGKRKPASANDFLEQFVKDVKNIMLLGVNYNNTKFSVSIHSIICDAPAKSFITLTKGHTGYFSCSKCVTEGEFIRNRMCFPDINCRERTDEGFRNLEQEEHHCGCSILLDILGLGLISMIPLDYMHLICIGCVKKLLKMWMMGPLDVRCLSSQRVKRISDLLLQLRNYIPIEFSRRPRELESISQWKATELRQFLLYTGPFVLQTELKKSVFINFLSLHIAIRLLCSETLRNIAYANSLLRHFVETFKIIYGEGFVSHNIHGLIHIAKDCEAFGSLDRFSAFPFENFMKDLKKLIRKSERPLQQISNRYGELLNSMRNEAGNIDKMHTQLRGEHTQGPLTNGCTNPQYSKIISKDFTLTCKVPDNCCSINGDIVCVENIATSTDGGLLIIGRKFLRVHTAYDEPCSSSLLGTFKTSDELSVLQSWPFDSVAHKLMKFPWKNENGFIVIPILHSDKFN